MTAAFARWTIYTHRWLGAACCILFAIWFASGVVMMYQRMPALSAEERLWRLTPLDTSTLALNAAEAAARLGPAAPERVRVAMLGGRPVYRLEAGGAWRAVYGDTGDVVGALTAADTLAIVQEFIPEHATTLRYRTRLDDSDQWTLSSVIRRQMPLHVVALGDDAGSEVYVADRTGEIVMKTDRRGRAWGYAGAVLHWIYFAPLRRRAALWDGIIVYGSLVGCLMALSGLVAGVWRWSAVPRYRLRGRPAPTRSPYAGIMRWHHYAGLVFGVVTFTWILSGLLSMNPWDWSPGHSPTAAQSLAMAGGPLRSEAVTVESLRNGVAALSRAWPVKEVDVVQVGGALWLSAYRVPEEPVGGAWRNTDLAAFLSPQSALQRRLVSLDDALAAPVDRLDARLIERLTRVAGPAAPVRDVRWLSEYDAYYYDREGARPLPVLRIRFDDRDATWLYADPRSGQLVAREVRRSRVERWLYHGLHSFDIPWLHAQRPLWDVLLVGLSLGGLTLAVTAVLPAWRRTRRALGVVRAAAAAAPAPSGVSARGRVR